MSIDRIRPGAWNSKAVIHGDMIYLSGMVADDKAREFFEQATEFLCDFAEVVES